MRTRVVLIVLLTGAGVLGLAILATSAIRSRPAASSPEAGVSLPAGHSPVSREIAKEKAARVPEPLPAAGTPAPVAAAAGPDSPEAILAALENPERDVRADALERAKQIEDRSVVPRLQEIAQRTEDVQQKAAILAVVDYINLPSVAEVQAAHQSNRLAHGLPDLPRASTNRFTGKPFIRGPQPAPSPGNP
jgi:hypothetical protein